MLEFSLEDSLVSDHIHHLVDFIKVRLQLLLAVSHPLSQTRPVFKWINSCRPELSEFTHSLDVSNGNLITVNELVVFQEIRLEHVL